MEDFANKPKGFGFVSLSLSAGGEVPVEETFDKPRSYTDYCTSALSGFICCFAENIAL